MSEPKTNKCVGRLTRLVCWFMCLFLCVTSLAQTESQKDEDAFKRSGQLVWVFTATDFISTEIALSQGGFERNLLMQKRAVRIPLKLGLTYVSLRLTKFAADHGHTKKATVLRWCLVGLYAFATGNNITVSF